jgi:hypothetical protein
MRCTASSLSLLACALVAVWLEFLVASLACGFFSRELPSHPCLWCYTQKGMLVSRHYKGHGTERLYHNHMMLPRT